MSAKKKPAPLKELREQAVDDMREKGHGTFLLYMVLRGLVIFAAILSFLDQHYENMALCLLALFMFLLPSLLERQLRIELPSLLEKITLLFIFAAAILGEISSFYLRFPWWDTMLHTLNGFLCAAVGFALVDILNSNPTVRLNLSPFYLALVAFCFSMTVGVLWEFFEFFMDSVFHFDMQKDTVVHLISSVKLNPNGSNTPKVISNITSVVVDGEELGVGGYLDIGLFDTMKDLIVNFIGAVVFSVIGFFYARSPGRNQFASRFIPVRPDEKD